MWFSVIRKSTSLVEVEAERFVGLTWRGLRSRCHEVFMHRQAAKKKGVLTRSEALSKSRKVRCRATFNFERFTLSWSRDST